MTKDDIIRMAREAGFAEKYGYVTDLVCIDCFAALVAAAEREACAKVTDGWPDYDVQGLAEAIRARGNT